MDDMDMGEEIDQFQLLEKKVDSLIKLITSLKREKEPLVEKINIQEEKIADLTKEVEHLKGIRYKAKQSIVSLLEKIEQLEV